MAINDKYTERNISRLLEKIDYSKVLEYQEELFSKQEITFYSTIVNNAKERSVAYLETKNPNAINSYYLTLEQIM